MIWHSTKLDEVLTHLGTDPKNGLTTEVAQQKLERYGENRLIGKKKISFGARFGAQLKKISAIVLMAAAAITLITAIIFEPGEISALLEPVIIVAIIIINALLGAFQESRVESAIKALKAKETPTARVIRDGELSIISAAELVPGDLIQLKAGDYIPADARLVEVSFLHCDESTLTGETLPVEKLLVEDLNDIAPIEERLNMIYSGCSVTYGEGLAVVIETGMYTEIGKNERLALDADESNTPLKQKAAALGRTLGFVVFGACVLIFLIGFIQALVAGENVGTRILSTFMATASLAVAAIPESLAAIATLVLAMSVHKMIRRNSIIRNLPAAETLGNVSVICTDKTGTLTKGHKTLVALFDGNEITKLGNTALSESAAALLKYAAMCCNTSADNTNDNPEALGDPTEAAISVAAQNTLGLSKYDIDNMYPRMGEIPFDPERRLMTTVNIINGQPIAIVKGAPEVLLERCEGCDTEDILKITNGLAQEALHILGVAIKPLAEIPANPNSEDLECGLHFIGLLGMRDSLDKSTLEAIAKCKKSGIKTIMISGDHITTATAFAKKSGILYDDLKAITGAELAQMTDEEFFEQIDKIAVYARVTPEDKLRIVTTWQQKGETVALTGDGLNDTEALRRADVGFAMGIAESHVAKGAADVILTDNSFTSVVSAISGGRAIFENLRKSAHYLLSCNLGEILAVLFGTIIWGNSPFSALQLLWINLVTDYAPALTLSAEGVEDNIMEQPPRKKDCKIISKDFGIKTLWSGAMIGILALIAYAIGFSSGSASIGRTMAFAVIAFSQIVHSFNARSDRSVVIAGALTNPALIVAAVLSVGLILAVMLIPGVSTIFGLASLSKEAWIGVALLSVLPLAIGEIVKAISAIRKQIAK